MNQAAVPRFVKWQKAKPPTEQEAEAILNQEGYQAFRWTDLPGSRYPRHKHQIDECIWVLAGEITFSIEEAHYQLKPGDRLYLPSKTHHTATVNEGNGTTYLVWQKR
jgi:quercetin dioxygenase-like cupin family protein